MIIVNGEGRSVYVIELRFNQQETVARASPVATMQLILLVVFFLQRRNTIQNEQSKQTLNQSPTKPETTIFL